MKPTPQQKGVPVQMGYRPETALEDINTKIGGKSSDFEFHEELGKGAHGIVIKVKSLKNDKTYVIKKIDLLQFKKRNKNDVHKEAQILRKLKHPNIIRCYNSFVEGNILFIVMEYAENGDLHQVIHL